MLHQNLGFLDLTWVNLTPNHWTERHLISQFLGYSKGKSSLKEKKHNIKTFMVYNIPWKIKKNMQLDLEVSPPAIDLQMGNLQIPNVIEV